MQRTNRQYEIIIDKIKGRVIDVSERTIVLKAGTITIFYLKQLTDRTALSELVINPILQNKNEQNIDANILCNQITFADDCKLDSDENKIEAYILNGLTVILFSNDVKYAVINLKRVEKRSISEPKTMYTIRGPKDSFIEDLDTNLSLIKYRLKDVNLKVDMLEVGKRTKAPVAVVYFEDIANSVSVSEIKKRINNITTDGLTSSGELQAFLLNNKWSLFPQTGITERSDMACGALLEGKVLIFMEGSPWALIAPKVFSEYLWSSDDN